jgi:hypothetical protein
MEPVNLQRRELWQIYASPILTTHNCQLLLISLSGKIAKGMLLFGALDKLKRGMGERGERIC